MTRLLLVRLLSVALVPVLLVTSAREAIASDTIVDSPRVGFNMTLPGHAYGYSDVSCVGEVWMQWAGADAANPNASSFFKWDSITCAGGPDLSPGWSQPGEPGSDFRIWVTGAGCGSSASGTVAGHDDNGFSHVVGSIASPYGYHTGDALCDPANVCLRLTERGPGSSSTSEECVPITIDVPPELQDVYEEATQCVSGTVARPTIGDAQIREYPGSAGTRRLQWVQPLDFPVSAVLPVPAAGWGIYAVGQTVTSNSNETSDDNPNMWQIAQGVPSAIAGGTWVGGTAVKPVGRYELQATPSTQTTLRVFMPLGPSIQKSGTNSPNIVWQVVGAGIYGYPEGGSVNRTKYQQYFNGTGSFGRIGRTEPGLCSFYWGTKLFEVVGVTTDDPSGTLDPPPPPVVDPEPESCEDDPEQDECLGGGGDTDCGAFSVLDPSSWAGVGACLLVKLIRGVIRVLGDILGAIKGLVVALTEALGDLLKALFVPDSQHFKNKIGQVKDAWEDTAPGEIIGIVTSVPGMFLAPSGTLDCAGPGLPVTFPGFSGGDTVLHPLSTCNSGMAQIASIFKLALQVGVWCSALFVALRLMTSALGYQTSVGRGGDDT